MSRKLPLEFPVRFNCTVVQEDLLCHKFSSKFARTHWYAFIFKVVVLLFLSVQHQCNFTTNHQKKGFGLQKENWKADQTSTKNEACEYISICISFTFYHVSNGKAQKAIFRRFYFQVSHRSWHGAWNLCNFSCCLWSKVLSRGWLPAHSSLPSQQSQIPSLTRPLGIHEGELLLKRNFLRHF